MLARRRPKNKRSVLIKFQPWLTAGAVVLNLAATGSAAISAYYSSKQSELATEAVNRQSRNEAFSELIKAYDALCSVSVNPRDQWYVLGFESGYAIVNADFDAIEADKDKFEMAAYFSEWREKFTELERRYLFLRVWLTDEEQNNIVQVLPDSEEPYYYEELFKGNKAPAEVEIYRANVKCRMMLFSLVSYFQRNDYEKDIRQFIDADEVLIYPFSNSGRSLDDMLRIWGLESTADILKKYQ